MTSFATLAADPYARQRFTALAEAAASIGDPQVRNRGTIAGNLASGMPGEDLPAVALALGATLVIAGPDGTREAAADGFFIDSFETSLRPGEIITRVDFPFAGGAGSAYEKFENPASCYAICGVAAAIVLNEEGSVSECGVAVCGATNHASRLRSVETGVEGKRPSPEVFARAAANAADGLNCVSDLAASGEYRAHLASVLAERALGRAYSAAAK
jgi:carbon-monoxide dehydrogenase medium subunit